MPRPRRRRRWLLLSCVLGALLVMSAGGVSAAVLVGSGSNVAGVYRQTGEPQELDIIKWTESGSGTARDIAYMGNGVVTLYANGSFNFRFDCAIREYTTAPPETGYSETVSNGTSNYNGIYSYEDGILTLYSLPVGDLRFQFSYGGDCPVLVENTTRAAFRKSTASADEASL